MNTQQCVELLVALLPESKLPVVTEEGEVRLTNFVEVPSYARCLDERGCHVFFLGHKLVFQRFPKRKTYVCRLLNDMNAAGTSICDEAMMQGFVKQVERAGAELTGHRGLVVVG